MTATPSTLPGPTAHALGAGENPRPVITGVTPVQKRLFEVSGGGHAAFDWYASTVFADADDVLNSLADNLGGEVRPGQALHGYSYGWEIHRPEGIVARALTGGDNGSPHAWASGADAERYAEVVRALWPDTHRVSRMDSRIDFNDGTDSDDVWKMLFRACVRLAKKSNLKTSLAGDYLGKSGGRTLYVGSKKSGVFVRLYEKGKQLHGLTRDESEREGIALGWVRLEVQVRPVKDGRERAATATPEGAWGFGKWASRLYQDVTGLDVEHVTQQVKRETDDERALMWVARQYGGTFERLAKERGWPAVWQMLGDQVAKNQGLAPAESPR